MSLLCGRPDGDTLRIPAIAAPSGGFSKFQLHLEAAVSRDTLSELARRIFLEEGDEFGRIEIDMPLSISEAARRAHDRSCNCQDSSHLESIEAALRDDPLIAAEDQRRWDYCVSCPHA